MKVGILTFHFAFNQGAVLQCYAMQRYLESQGHEACVIDYRPKYHTVQHEAWRNPFIYARVFWKKNRKKRFPARVYLTARSFARCLVWNVMGVDKQNQAAFRSFEKRHLHLTDKYLTLDQLRKNPPKLDVYLSGSDQVWNPDLLEQKFDKAYFLDFGGKETHRITYAVSMGKLHDAETLKQLRDLCKGLDAISLREYSRTDIEAIGRDVHVCIDPTLLLDASDYAEVESEVREASPYIFVYGFENNEALRQAVEAAVRKYNCRVINGSPKWLQLSGNTETLSGYGPDSFLSLIKNAECVITNSFHGTAFSIIYKKDFITVPHTTRGKRMEDLLSKLGLSFRLFGGTAFSFEKPIDYESVYDTRDRLRRHSEEYLALALSGCRGEEIPQHMEDDLGNQDKNPENREHALTAYYGYYIDPIELLECASGGVATELSKQILNKDGVVFGVAYSDDYKAYMC